MDGTVSTIPTSGGASMKSFTLATVFLPDWTLPWIAVLACAAWIVGARGLAASAAGLVLADLYLAPLLAPWLAQVPTWVVLLIGGVFVLSILHGVIGLLFGEETTGHVTGTYLVRLFDWLLLGPFRLLGTMVRLLLRG
jgi:hypothetical protein